MNRSRPLLFERFPGLQEKLPWVSLGTFPTAIHRLDQLAKAAGAPGLWIKRDDQSAESYGGNKVRKLEFTLAEAKHKGRDRIVTFGAVGSNHVLATTIHAKALGMKTVGIFIPQPVQENLRTNILCNGALGCTIEYAGSMPGAAVKAVASLAGAWIRERKLPYLLMAGGSGAVGDLGYLEAALEIAEQEKQGLIPRVDYIFVPVGSGGTHAGLVLGLKLIGHPAKAVGVRVYDRRFANERTVANQANASMKLLHKLDPQIPVVTVKPNEVMMLHDYFGAGYATYTKKAVDAMKLMRETEGIGLEGTYSGKNLAGLIDFMKKPENKDKTAVFINTYNSRPLDGMVNSCAGPGILPESIRANYFDCEIEPVKD